MSIVHAPIMRMQLFNILSSLMGREIMPTGNGRLHMPRGNSGYGEEIRKPNASALLRSRLAITLEMFATLFDTANSVGANLNGDLLALRGLFCLCHLPFSFAPTTVPV